MRVHLAGLACAAVALTVLSSLGCASGADDDSAGKACQVVVRQCGVGDSVGDCIDTIGSLPVECLDCIASSGCDYPTCQRLPVGCRLPLEMTPQ